MACVHVHANKLLISGLSGVRCDFIIKIDSFCGWKKCRSRSADFIRSQLIQIYTFFKESIKNFEILKHTIITMCWSYRNTKLIKLLLTSFQIEQLSDQTGEESIILTASINEGALSHLGSNMWIFLVTDRAIIRSDRRRIHYSHSQYQWRNILTSGV